MRLRISLSPADTAPINLPVQYNHLVQGLIYSNLDRALADWLHERGHPYGLRPFKLFTFSRLHGRSTIRDGRIVFTGPVSFHLSAVDVDVLSSLAEHLLKRPAVHLGKTQCRVDEVAIEPAPSVDFGRPVLVRMLSPVTAYSTLSSADGRKKTYYYVPQEREWSAALIANVARKARSLEWVSDVERDLEGAWVRPRRIHAQDQKILNFKGTVIKAWMGLYEVHLPEPYFWLAYDAGLGSKNAQGFGMVEVVK